MQKGDDLVTTFLGGCIGMVVLGVIIIAALGFIFS